MSTTMIPETESEQVESRISDTPSYIDVKIYFEDFIVQVIADSYVYDYISIVSEVGGCIGILHPFHG